MGQPFDVAIVGASIGGCTAARLFAQAGARVALIERHADPEAYKVTCTHAIQPCATPTIERLGLAPLLEARGALRPGASIWSPYGGWLEVPADLPRGWGVTRRTLDPMLRELAAGTPGVELLLGRTAVDLVGDGRRPAGVKLDGKDGQTQTVHARLVVGADGRGSTVARLAGVPGRVRRHNRFFYFSYWRGVRPSTDVRGWMMDPDGAAQFPNEDDQTVLVASMHRSRLGEFKADLEGAYARHLAGLPDGPDLSEAERTSKLIGKLEMPNVIRPAARPGLAFVGDAAMASDPLWGVGVGWAFQSAHWLVDEVAPALTNGGDLDAALESYARVFRRRLAVHHLVTTEYASGRKTFPWERSFFRAASGDPVLAREMGLVAGRLQSPLRLLDPRVAGRVFADRLKSYV
jgi:2-polyprenyl-6-methoxyphenol hydroxylase-like FAD-dependent oxidoreductase